MLSVGKVTRCVILRWVSISQAARYDGCVTKNHPYGVTCRCLGDMLRESSWGILASTDSSFCGLHDEAQSLSNVRIGIKLQDDIPHAKCCGVLQNTLNAVVIASDFILVFCHPVFLIVVPLLSLGGWSL